MKKTFLAILATAIFATPVLAQEDDDQEPLEYAYPFTIEIQMGHTRNLNQYHGVPDKGLSVCGADRGFDITLRASTFFTDHWGAFASVTFNTSPVSCTKAENRLGRNDRGRYDYLNVDRTSHYCFWDAQDDGGGASADWWLVGPVYRYDKGRWSFRGRLGLGLARHYAENAHYLRFDAKEDKLEKMSIVAVKKTDEKYTNYVRPVVHAFAYQPSIQAVFTPCTHFYFSAEIALTGSIGHFYERVQLRSVEASEAPSLWFHEFKQIAIDEGCTYSFEEKYKTDSRKVLSETHHRVHPGNFLAFNLGIGWNIGWNRVLGKQKR